MKIAITGGGNVYALRFARHLNELGIDHFGIGRGPRKPPAFWQVEHHYRYYEAHLVSQLDAALAILDTERPDVVVNFAAQGEGQASFGEHAALFYQTNTLGLVRFAEALRTRDYLSRFVQIGTSELYGSTETPATEDAPIRPSSPYAVSKAAFDLHLQTMHRVHGFPMNVIRPSNCICPGQQLHRIVPKAILCALTGRKLPLHGGGRAEKSYMDAACLATAIMAVVDGGRYGEIYNAGPSRAMSIATLVALVGQECGTLDFVEHAPERRGQDSRYWLDSSRLRSLRWAQPISIDISWTIGRMVEWIKKHPELRTYSTDYAITP